MKLRHPVKRLFQLIGFCLAAMLIAPFAILRAMRTGAGEHVRALVGSMREILKREVRYVRGKETEADRAAVARAKTSQMLS